MTGFARFRDWLPEPLLRIVDPADAVDDEFVRTAIAIAVVWFFAAFAVRICLRVGFGLTALSQRRTLFEGTRRKLLWIRRIIGFLAIALPWAPLLQMHWAWSPWLGSYSAAGLCFGLWAVLRAGDHAAIWLDERRGELVARAGFGLGRVTVERLAAGQLWRDASARDLEPHEEIWQFVSARFVHSGSARAWLSRLARHQGGKLAERVDFSGAANTNSPP